MCYDEIVYFDYFFKTNFQYLSAAPVGAMYDVKKIHPQRLC